jgi:monoamine oxidase
MACLGLVAAHPEPATGIDYSAFKEDDIITRDVCVIGGGSGGTYAATRLRQLNQSVIVIEKDSLMGGNTNTYTVPGSSQTNDLRRSCLPQYLHRPELLCLL